MTTQVQSVAKSVSLNHPVNLPEAKLLPLTRSQKPTAKYVDDVDVKYIGSLATYNNKVANALVSKGDKIVSDAGIKPATITDKPKDIKLVPGDGKTIVAKTGKSVNSVTVPTERMDASVQVLTNPGTRKSADLEKDPFLVNQTAVKEISEYNLSYAYGIDGSAKDPVKTPFNRSFRPILKGKDEITLVQQPRFMPLGQSHIGGVYGTDRFKYNDAVEQVQLLDTMD